MHSPSQFPRAQFVVLVLLLATFLAAFGVSFTFAPLTDVFPRYISAIGAFLALVELVLFAHQYWKPDKERRKHAPAAKLELDALLAEFRSISPYILWLLAYFVLIWLIGLIIASGLFALLFLLLVARMKPWEAVLGGLAAAAVVFLIADLLSLALPQALYDPFFVYRRILRLPSF